jgi:hypothetical protein
MSVQPGAVNLYPGQSQTIAVANSSGVLTTKLDTPLVQVTIDQSSHTATIAAAQQTGRATLTIADATGAQIQIPIRVAYPAATVPPEVVLRVTGNPIDSGWLQQQIQNALSRNVQIQSGAGQPQFGPMTLPAFLGPGVSAAIPVQVHVSGGTQYFDIDVTTSIALQNVDVAPFSPALLFYDDDPEKIVQNGVLYRNQVSSGTPARLYYYHQNNDDSRQLLVVLSSAQPSSVQIIDSSAGPNLDVMTVGHTVTRNFLVQKPRNEGLVVDIPAASPFVADTFAMTRLAGAAGTIGLQVLSGGPVTVTVVAAPADLTGAQIPNYLTQPRVPGDGHHRTGAFVLGDYGNTFLSYTLGGQDAVTQYGATTPPSADPGANGHDYGDYGVWRTITFNIDNPGIDPAVVYLYERPLGGVVRSSFLVNNASLVQPGCVRVAQRYQIGPPVHVPQGQSRVTVQTMTDGGSNYPLEVGITTSSPVSTPPPMNAPDGCFPKPSASPPSSPAPGSSPRPVPEPTGR